MSKPCILIGGGGHASVLADILLSQKREILAIASLDDISGRAVFAGIKHLTRDEDVFSYNKNDVVLINGIGPQPKSSLRRNIANRFKSHGFIFDQVISETAVISRFVELGEAVQVLHGAVIQNGSELGVHSIVNTCASVDHDCKIGNFNHIAPGAILCGDVRTKEGVYIGAGATIVQSVLIESLVIVGAGAVVTKNLKEKSVFFPARSSMKGDV